MTTSVDLVKKLRLETGLGLADCKSALDRSDGDLEKAKTLLRTEGKKAIASGQSSNEGTVGRYIHHNGQIAALVEVNSQTDFTARNDEFREFANKVAMHIASADPTYVRREDVPTDLIAKERDFHTQQAKASGRPDNIIETKILPGKMNSFFAQICLLEQPFVADEKVTIGEMLNTLAAKVGEHLTIRRFIRYQVGGTIK